MAMPVVLVFVPLIRLGCVVLSFAACFTCEDRPAHIQVQTYFALEMDGEALITSGRKMDRASTRSGRSVNRLVHGRCIDSCGIPLGAEILDIKNGTGSSALRGTALHWDG